jgi:hypothetical protein
MEGALVGEREDRNEEEADVKFGDDSRKVWETDKAVEATKNAEQIDYTMVLCKHSRCARQIMARRVIRLGVGKFGGRKSMRRWWQQPQGEMKETVERLDLTQC